MNADPAGVELAAAAKNVIALAAGAMPITNGIVAALEGREIVHVITDFMRRPPTGE